jgi:hypothetical protein
VTPSQAYKLAFIQGLSDGMLRKQRELRTVDDLTRALGRDTSQEDGPSVRSIPENPAEKPRSYFGPDGYHGLGMANQGDVGLNIKAPNDTGV